MALMALMAPIGSYWLLVAPASSPGSLKWLLALVAPVALSAILWLAQWPLGLR